MRLTKPCTNPKHLAHIVCVDAMHFINRTDDGFCDYELQAGDVWCSLLRCFIGSPLVRLQSC